MKKLRKIAAVLLCIVMIAASLQCLAFAECVCRLVL